MFFGNINCNSGFTTSCREAYDDVFPLQGRSSYFHLIISKNNISFFWASGCRYWVSSFCNAEQIKLQSMSATHNYRHNQQEKTGLVIVCGLVFKWNVFLMLLSKKQNIHTEFVEFVFYKHWAVFLFFFAIPLLKPPDISTEWSTYCIRPSLAVKMGTLCTINLVSES